MVDGVLPGRRRPALEGEELLDGPVVVEELDEAAVRQRQKFAVDVGPRPFGGLVGGALLAHEVRLRVSAHRDHSDRSIVISRIGRS